MPTAEEIIVRLTREQIGMIIVFEECHGCDPAGNIMPDYPMGWGERCPAWQIRQLVEWGVLQAVRSADPPVERHPEGFDVDLDHYWTLTELGQLVRARMVEATGG